MTNRVGDGPVEAVSLPYHICTEYDLSQFYTPTKRAKKILDGIAEDPDRRFYCIDDEVDVTIWGKQPTNYRTLEILWVPCNVENNWDAQPDPIPEECERSLDA